MAFTPFHDGYRQPYLKVDCDCCDTGTEDVRAIHGPDGKDGEGQARLKLQKNGWGIHGKKMKCPACVAKAKSRRKPKKEAPMSNTPPQLYAVCITDPDAETEQSVTSMVEGKAALTTAITEAAEVGYEVKAFRCTPLDLKIKRVVTVEIDG